jgi:hypothetical protein
MFLSVFKDCVLQRCDIAVIKIGCLSEYFTMLNAL